MKLISSSLLVLIVIFNHYIVHFSTIIKDNDNSKQICLNMFEHRLRDCLHFLGKHLVFYHIWWECTRRDKELLVLLAMVSFKIHSDFSCTNWHHYSSCIPTHVQYPSLFVQFTKDWFSNHIAQPGRRLNYQMYLLRLDDELVDELKHLYLSKDP